MRVIKCDQCKVDIDNDKIFVGTFRKAEFAWIQFVKSLQY